MKSTDMIVNAEELLSLDRSSKRRGFIAGFIFCSLLRYFTEQKRAAITTVVNTGVEKAKEVLKDANSNSD